ncbi:transposase family protein, partial [Anoxybacillus ayderensis]
QERCPHCGVATSCVHDRRTRKVRDLAIFHQPVYLFVKVKRYRCWNCSQVFSASLESIQPNQHYTNRFCEHLYELCEGSTIQEVSRKHHIPYTTLERIYYCKFANYLFCTLANYFGLEYTYKIRSTGFTWSGGHVRLVA